MQPRVRIREKMYFGVPDRQTDGRTNAIQVGVEASLKKEVRKKLVSLVARSLKEN